MQTFNAKKFVLVGNEIPEQSVGNPRCLSVDGNLEYKGVVDGRRLYYVQTGQGYKISLLWGNVITPILGAKIIDSSGVAKEKEKINLLTHTDYAVVCINNSKFLICSYNVWIPIQKEVLICLGLLPQPGIIQDFDPPQLSGEEIDKLQNTLASMGFHKF